MLPTFPSRYWFAIGLPVIFSLAGWSPLLRTGFLVSRPTQETPSTQPRYPYGPLTLCGPTFQTVPVPGCVSYGRPYYPACASTPAVWAPPLSLATTQGIDSFFLLLQVLRCFSSLRSPRLRSLHGIRPCGFPHSDSHGSLPVCGSPWIFAAYRVLLRFRKPRHPPFALLLFLSSRVTFESLFAYSSCS